ncbi:MAG TPA: hypothetical protein VGY77_03005 [Gemmataceae bacterium]|nr:hypothetical protein [Gemmataceae bacterium]
MEVQLAAARQELQRLRRQLEPQTGWRLIPCRSVNVKEIAKAVRMMYRDRPGFKIAALVEMKLLLIRADENTIEDITMLVQVCEKITVKEGGLNGKFSPGGMNPGATGEPLRAKKSLDEQRPSENNSPPKELELSYEAFDQRPGGGWRKIADEGKYLQAAQLIDRYEMEKKGLEERQRVNLRFHAGQLYAFADQKDLALARFRTALVDKEPADSPIRWNAYVRATIAFLERDRKKLTELREEIAKGPKVQGAVANLDVVDRLIAHFDEPYSVAYRGKPKESK